MGGQLPTKLWVAPPTKMDEAQLTSEGYYGIFGSVGARTEMPGCSLCMGNQARVADECTVVSTSTRNFPNRLAMGPMFTLLQLSLLLYRLLWAAFLPLKNTLNTRRILT